MEKTKFTADGQEIYNVIVENGSGNPYTNKGLVMGTYSGKYLDNWHSLNLKAPGIPDGKHECILKKEGDNETWALVPDMPSYNEIKTQRDELYEACNIAKEAFESLVRNDILAISHHPEAEKYIALLQSALLKAGGE